MPPTPSAQLSRAVTAVAMVGTAAGLGLVAAVEVIRAAATATAARAAAGAAADIKAAEIPKATGALAEVTLVMVTPAVIIDPGGDPGIAITTATSSAACTGPR
jgi:hypothetical protein